MGIPEIILILAIALILFGPEDLPDIARTIGKVVFEVRKATQELTREFQDSMDPITKNTQNTQKPQSEAKRPLKDEVLLTYDDETPKDPLAELPLDMVSYEEKGASR
ncbi:MAG TPA: twin-arginine translocase TatA/TatE family subunit [Desulfosporosinus sp.]|nr:twin-arginine translocase TatA/TatE family subunit [Desulfosporosinus sp.]